MATSNSYDYALNAREIVTYALEKLNVKDLGGNLKPHEAASALRELNLMLKSWQRKGPHLWKKIQISVPLVAATPSVDLSSYNILRVISGRYKPATGSEIPMDMLEREEYFDLPLKTSAGIPTTFYYDAATGLFYGWPVKASVTTETFELTTQKKIQDLDDLDNDLDVPQEHLETVGYNLAARLADNKRLGGEAINRIIARATMLHQDALDYDREDTVVFCPGEY